MIRHLSKSKAPRLKSSSATSLPTSRKISIELLAKLRRTRFRSSKMNDLFSCNFFVRFCSRFVSAISFTDSLSNPSGYIGSNDPDVIVGHDFSQLDLDVFLTRLRDLKIDNWSQVGRLRVPGEKWPVLRSGRNTGLLTGRLILDLSSDGSKVRFSIFDSSALEEMERLTPESSASSRSSIQQLGRSPKCARLISTSLAKTSTLKRPRSSSTASTRLRNHSLTSSNSAKSTATSRWRSLQKFKPYL